MTARGAAVLQEAERELSSLRGAGRFLSYFYSFEALSGMWERKLILLFRT